MTLFELATLNSPGEYIAHRDQKRDFLRIEVALARGADAEDAVGAAIVAGNGNAKTAGAAVIDKKLRNLEPGFAGKLTYDRRARQNPE